MQLIWRAEQRHPSAAILAQGNELQSICDRTTKTKSFIIYCYRHCAIAGYNARAIHISRPDRERRGFLAFRSDPPHDDGAGLDMALPVTCPERFYRSATIWPRTNPSMRNAFPLKLGVNLSPQGPCWKHVGSTLEARWLIDVSEQLAWDWVGKRSDVDMRWSRQ